MKKHPKPPPAPARSSGEPQAQTAETSNKLSKETPTEPVNTTTELTSDRNVDQIRDILFGGQMKDYERRFRELSQKLDLEIQRSGEMIDRKFSLIEKRLDEQGERLTRLIRQESSERGQQAAEVDTRLQQAQRALRSELQAATSDLEMELKTREQRIRDSLDETSSAVMERFAELSSALSRTEAGLREDKLGRIDLATLLSEMALRIGGDIDASEQHST